MIRIRTLGGLSASRDGQPATGAAIQPRRLALLALVARAGERGTTREQLLARLWPDADDTSGRRALSQALHALRNELHDELFAGVQELRLNDDIAGSDIRDFEMAVADRAWERAAAAWSGPFLDGFRLAGAPEFDRWMEEERAQLAHRYADVLERLARLAAEKGDLASSVQWWRRRAAMDAINPRVTLELMRALANLGERHAALQQARIYETLLNQELGLPPDADVVRYAEALRHELSTPPVRLPAAPASAATPQAPEPSSSPAPVPLPEFHPHERQFAPTRAAVVVVAVAFIAALAVIWAQRSPKQPPLVAVGAIVDYRGKSETGPLSDMLATNLARIPGLQVTSTARLLELIERAGKPRDAAAFAAAARRAGATELVEGGLHATNDALRLELRRVDLQTGRVVDAWQLNGKDFFVLVDLATNEFAASLGRGAELLGPGEPSTRSLVAWRLYEEGLRQAARGDHRGAQGLFESALAEDSSFAMAAFYLLRSRDALDIPPDSAQREWLTRLARRTNDRDRLQIHGWVAFAAQSPALDALADTLIIRYPADIESQFLAGFARMARADFSGALPYLHRVLAADSASQGKRGVRCLACDAQQHLIYAYAALDSIPRAHEVALAWTKNDPQSNKAWASLGHTLDLLGRQEEAITARRRANPYDVYDNVFPATVKLRGGDFTTADAMSRSLMMDGSDEESSWQGFWVSLVSLRYQARWREIDDIAERRFATLNETRRSGVDGRRIRNAQVMARFDAGRSLEARHLIDSLIRHLDPDLPLGGRSRILTVYYAMLGETALATNDAELASTAADSAEAWAHRDGKLRETGIALHARGIAALARHDTLAAIRTLEQAIFSPTLGFTRSNLHLARLLMARGETRRAAGLLRAALQGSIENSNYFVTHTEVRELLATAYEALNKPDSAAAHWRWVSTALTHADSAAHSRYASAIAHLMASRLAAADSTGARRARIIPTTVTPPRAKRP